MTRTSSLPTSKPKPGRRATTPTPARYRRAPLGRRAPSPSLTYGAPKSARRPQLFRGRMRAVFRCGLSFQGPAISAGERSCSNQLEAFSIERLLVDPAQALISTTPVGPAPVGLQLVAEGRLIAVANSNRSTTAPGSVSIVSTQRALNHQPATQKTFNVGLFFAAMGAHRRWHVVATDRV